MKTFFVVIYFIFAFISFSVQAGEYTTCINKKSDQADSGLFEVTFLSHGIELTQYETKFNVHWSNITIDESTYHIANKSAVVSSENKNSSAVVSAILIFDGVTNTLKVAFSHDHKSLRLYELQCLVKSEE